jgi:hypothetical protein
MKHAVLVRVKLDSKSDLAHRRAILNDYVIPEVKALPGFHSAMWLNDGDGTGICIVVFDSRENAESSLGYLTAPGGPPVISCAIYVIEAEA